MKIEFTLIYNLPLKKQLDLHGALVIIRSAFKITTIVTHKYF